MSHVAGQAAYKRLKRFENRFKAFANALSPRAAKAARSQAR